jgi:hypothetical protein
MSRIQILILVLLAVAQSAAAQVARPELRDELLAMLKLDQEERNKCTVGDAEFQSRCLVRLAETIDAVHTKRLEQIFAEHGLPDTKMVGAEGLKAFMVMLQHSPNETLRTKAEKAITKAFERKELTPLDYANYIDRLRLRQGKLQIYGSGFEIKDGKLVLSPTLDLKNLEKRRRKIGLPPMSEHIKVLREMYKLEVEMPKIGEG